MNTPIEAGSPLHPPRSDEGAEDSGVRPHRRGDWMQTATGVQFWPLDPRPAEIHIRDIAHSLANQCRFAGHCTEFYSVAQHSVLVSQIVPPEDALWGLLHDATEAYLVDLPRPVKRYSRLGDEYRDIEARLMIAVCDAFGLPHAEPESVKLADDILLMTEKRDVMGGSPAKWRETAEPTARQIIPWVPFMARAEFLLAFDRLADELALRSRVLHQDDAHGAKAYQEKNQ